MPGCIRRPSGMRIVSVNVEPHIGLRVPRPGVDQVLAENNCLALKECQLLCDDDWWFLGGVLEFC